jgi:hypothetical protein
VTVDADFGCGFRAAGGVWVAGSAVLAVSVFSLAALSAASFSSSHPQNKQMVIIADNNSNLAKVFFFILAAFQNIGFQLFLPIIARILGHFHGKIKCGQYNSEKFLEKQAVLD